MARRVRPRLSLTDFVDIALKVGPQKATKISQIKNRGDYTPAVDYYRKLRNQIIETHQENRSRAHFRRLIFDVPLEKLRNYDIIREGYSKWWGRKELKWFEPATCLYEKHGIEVNINPELGLLINDEPHLIKLYFKSESLSKNKVNITLHLMNISLNDMYEEDITMSILDIRNSKLITATHHDPMLDASVDGELAYIAALWASV